jgi:acetyl esterase/lipase
LSEHEPQRTATLALAQNLRRKWSDAWEGRGAAPTVSSANPVFAETLPAPGKLMMANRRSGHASTLAHGDYGAVYVSPDRKRFAAVRFAEAMGEAIFPIGRRGELEIFELQGDGAALKHRFPDMDVSAQAVAWSPGSERLLVGGQPRTGERRARLYVIDAESATVATIAPSGMTFADPEIGRASGVYPIGWIADRPAAIAARPSAGGDSPQGDRSLDYGEHAGTRRDLFVFDGARAINLTSSARGDVGEFLAPEGRDFAYVVHDGALARVSPLRPTEHLPKADAGPIVGFALEPRYPQAPNETARFASGTIERIAVNVATPHGAQVHILDVTSGKLSLVGDRGELVAMDASLRTFVTRRAQRWTSELVLKGQASRVLAAANDHLAQRSWAEPRRFSFQSGGKTLTGWMVAPPGSSPAARLPAVVVVYGGQVFGDSPPTAASGDAYLPVFSGQMLASQGYVVIYPSLPIGRGEADDIKKTLAEAAVAAVDALAQEGIVDPARVGLMGQSFGGYSTAAILAERSDRFRAAIALAGIYDWSHAYGGMSPERWLADDGRTSLPSAPRQAGLTQPFWREPQVYERASPIYSVEKIDTPLLILHGDLDGAFFDAARMYNALARAGKQPVLVRYWGEGHLALSEHAVRDQWSRINTWFGAYLKAE